MSRAIQLLDRSKTWVALYGAGYIIIANGGSIFFMGARCLDFWVNCSCLCSHLFLCSQKLRNRRKTALKALYKVS